MESIRELYRIGVGPSSSHTMGPRRAAQIFLTRHPVAHKYQVTLYESLAATGRGHLTDSALRSVFPSESIEIIWKADQKLPLHPNGMRFDALAEDGITLGHWEVYSVGGGALRDQSSLPIPQRVYDLTSMRGILSHCKSSGQAVWEYVEDREGCDIWNYLGDVWGAMRAAIKRGLQQEGVLPGGSSTVSCPPDARSIWAHSGGDERSQGSE